MKHAVFLFVVLIAAPALAQSDVDSVVSLLEFVIDVDEETAAKCLATLRTRVQSGEVTGEQLDGIREKLGEKLQSVLSDSNTSPLYFDAILLATSWGNADAAEIARAFADDVNSDENRRKEAITALTASRDQKYLHTASRLLTNAEANDSIKSHLLGALGKYDDATVASVALDAYAELPSSLQPQAIELLTQRTAWSKKLLEAIGRKDLPQSVLNVNQVRALLASSDKELASLVRSQWGAVRTERNPQREQVIREMHDRLSKASGNPIEGRAVFNRVCGQCHKIYGIGQDVGPEITRNGRGSFEHLLSNVFDPSLVIGASYQARTVVTADGRVLTGLLAEDNEQRIVLKTQGGKQEIIAREDVDEIAISKLSLMPEGLEKQLTPQQLADLFAFLSLDRPPEDASALPIAGTPSSLVGETQ